MITSVEVLLVLAVACLVLGFVILFRSALRKSGANAPGGRVLRLPAGETLRGGDVFAWRDRPGETFEIVQVLPPHVVFANLSNTAPCAMFRMRGDDVLRQMRRVTLATLDAPARPANTKGARRSAA